VLELVGELDLSAFTAAYRADGRGRPPYDPKMMIALIVYCRGKGIGSGRGIAAACYDDLGARGDHR
jgi:transposase